MIHINSKAFKASPDGKITSTLISKDATVILFYLPECKSCQAFLPIFEELTKKILFVKFVAVNCSKNSVLLSDLNDDYPSMLVKFPSILFYDNGDPKFKYTDARTFESIYEAIKCSYVNSKNLMSV